MLKKLFVSIVTIAMVFSLTTVAFAAQSKPTVGGAIAPTQQEQDAYLQSLTQNDLNQINAKNAEAEKLATRLTLMTATKISIPGTFTMYQQETSYYCVPASVKSTLNYLGSGYSQDSIASSLGTTSSGTDTTKIAPYLNSKQSFYYAFVSSPSQTTMCNDLYSTVANNGKPCLMMIYNPSGANWHYATSGHELVVNAVYSDNSSIQFADPLGGTQSGWPYFYEKSSPVANSVCNNIDW